MNERGGLTRQELLRLKAQKESVGKGLKLLKSKREALMKEFFAVVEETVRLREDLNSLLSAAQRRLEIVRALKGPELESFAHASKRELDLDISIKNVWGVKVPEVEEKPLARGLSARDVSPVGTGAGVLKVAGEFEAASELLVKIAARETRLSRVGEMIKTDTRKINAINEVLLPGMNKKISSIERVLEEREREEIFRLKKFKEREEK